MKKVEKNVLSLIAPIHERWSRTLTILTRIRLLMYAATPVLFAYFATEQIITAKGDWSDKILIIEMIIYTAILITIYIACHYSVNGIFDQAKTAEIYWWRSEISIILERSDFQRLCDKFGSSEPINENDSDYKSLMEAYRSQLMKSRHKATHMKT